MINLLVGAPGGGKSYEAVVFHVLAALGKGRKVITNLALHVGAFAAIEPGYADLIELRVGTLGPTVALGGKSLNKAAFSHIQDYGDPWRHPVNGAGPLYVIDECHIALPKVGTPIAVEEWFSLHRHEFADVLLISQSYGKLNVAIKDLLQIVYRVRKNIALGSPKSYTRKVQDGVRGAVVNSAIRRYEAKYFALYRSHTRSAEGIEMGAADIIPIWRHWTIYGIGFCLLLFGWIVWHFGNPLAMFKAKKAPDAVAGPSPGPGAPVARGSPAGTLSLAIPAGLAQAVPAKVTAASGWPYGALELHIGGVGRFANRTIMLIVFSQNGQKVFEQNNSELIEAGYKITRLNDCLARVQYRDLSQYISCDAPRLGVGTVLGAGVGSRGVPVEAPTASARAAPGASLIFPKSIPPS